MPEDDTNPRPSGQEAQRPQGARPDTNRRRARESFLADLDEAQRLRERVAPRRTRLARLRQQQLMRTFLH